MCPDPLVRCVNCNLVWGVCRYRSRFLLFILTPRPITRTLTGLGALELGWALPQCSETDARRPRPVQSNEQLFPHKQLTRIRPMNRLKKKHYTGCPWIKRRFQVPVPDRGGVGPSKVPSCVTAGSGSTTRFRGGSPGSRFRFHELAWNPTGSRATSRPWTDVRSHTPRRIHPRSRSPSPVSPSVPCHSNPYIISAQAPALGPRNERSRAAHSSALASP